MSYGHCLVNLPLLVQLILTVLYFHDDAPYKSEYQEHYDTSNKVTTYTNVANRLPKFY